MKGRRKVNPLKIDSTSFCFLPAIINDLKLPFNFLNLTIIISKMGDKCKF